jgi:hypothetical protein
VEVLVTDLPTYPLTVEGVEQALAELDKGGSEGVAIRLQELGIRGARGNECGCPVANYLTRAVASAETVTVSGDSVYVTGTDYEDIEGFRQPWEVLFHTTLPDAVSAFVEDFDQGIYPELIEEVKPHVG